MNSNDIQKWQAATITEALFPGMNYLLRLRNKMEKIGFPPDDELFKDVCAAYEAMNRLRLKMHYLSASGVAAPSTLGQAPIPDEP